MQLISHFQELIEKLGKRELPKDDYPCMNEPSPTVHAKNQSAAISQPPVAHSMRSRRTPTWARPRNSDDGYSRCCCCSSLHRPIGFIICRFIISCTVDLFLLILLPVWWNLTHYLMKTFVVRHLHGWIFVHPIILMAGHSYTILVFPVPGKCWYLSSVAIQQWFSTKTCI